MLFGEAYGRISIGVGGLPAGVSAVTVPVRRSREDRLPRDRRGRLRVHAVDLVPGCPADLFEPPSVLSSADLLWVLAAERRAWSTVVGRFGEAALQVATDLVRCGGVVLRCEVDEWVALGAPTQWRLSQAWSLQAEDRIAELRGAREPRRARADLMEVMEPLEQLTAERKLLAAVDPAAGLVVPAGSQTAAKAWSVYEAAIRAGASWWSLRAQGEEEVTLKQLAALALGGSKRWTAQQQAAFANLVGSEFEEAVHEEDTALRVKGPLSWHIGSVAADAAVAQPWVGLPANSLRLLGNAVCDAVGVLVVENSDTFGVVCRRLPELTSRWLCVWGSGYATDQLVAVLDWLSPLPVAAWCDLDADGIAIVDNLSRRLGRPVHAVGMHVDEWEAGPYRQRQKPKEDRERDRLLAAELAERVDGDLRELALAIAASGESREQETQYTSVLPGLPSVLEQFAQRPLLRLSQEAAG